MLKVDQALVSDFIGQSFGLPIAHENVDYKPTPGVSYLELRNLPNDIAPVGLSDTDDITGVFQFILRYPQGNGAIPAKAKADTIFAAYPIGRDITYSGQVVNVTGKSRPDAVPEDGWFKIVGQIFYRARLPRT